MVNTTIPLYRIGEIQFVCLPCREEGRLKGINMYELTIQMHIIKNIICI